MKQKIFYDHLVEIDEIILELDSFDIGSDEREEFISLIDEILHNQILEIILSDLPVEFHEEFLLLLQEGPHRPELLEYLKLKGSGKIEEKIKTHAKKVKEEIKKDIKNSSRKTK